MDFLADLQLPAEFGLCRLSVNKFGLGHQATLHHRRRKIELLGVYLETFLQLRHICPGFAQFVLPLRQARLQNEKLVLKIVASRDQQFLLVRAYFRGNLSDILGTFQRVVQATRLFLLQPPYPDLQGACLGFQFAQR